MSSSSTRLPTREGRGSGMTDARGESELPTPFEMGESVLLLITGAVLAAPMLPGFTLCVAGLIVLAVVVVAPVVAAAALITLAAAILAIPYALVGSIRSIRSRGTAHAPDVPGYPDAADVAAAPAATPSRSLG
jgi:hypothetical protein